MRRLTVTLVAIAVGSLGLVSGCTPRKPQAVNTFDVHAGDGGGIASTQVVVGSPRLDNTLRFGEPVARRDGLLMHAQIPVENLSDKGVAFEYRWEWTDADGFQLGDTLSYWQPGFVDGASRKLMGSTGPGPAATNFRLHLRERGQRTDDGLRRN